MHLAHAFRPSLRKCFVARLGIALTISMALSAPHSARGQETAPESDPTTQNPTFSSTPPSEPWPDELIRDAQLPPIPDDLQELLTNGNVVFVFYDESLFRRRFQGETRFEMNYDSKSEFRWREIRTRNGSRELVVRPQFRAVEVTSTHTVLLPKRLITDNFFDHPLVRHELDHIRISTDPRFAKTFTTWVRAEVRELRIPLGADATSFNSLAEKEIRLKLSAHFRELVDLVRVRYAELDQQTKHGALPVPQDFFKSAESEVPASRL